MSLAASWSRIDLGPYVRGEILEPEPAALDRADGVRLLYPGKVHWISGEPEGCKSWLGQIAVADALADGYSAVYVDHEGAPTTIIERLLALGVAVEAIQTRLAYYRPETPMMPLAVQQVLRAAGELQPLVSVIDGVGAAMGTSGFDSNKAADFYRWWEAFGQRLRKLTVGPMLAIDHVVKNAGERNQYATGTGQKQAAIDVHLGVEVIDQFGIGRTGRLRLVLHKDRAGRLRQHQAEDKTIGELVLKSEPDRTVRFCIEPPGDRAPRPFRPTALMERVSRHLEDATEPLSKRRIRGEVAGKERALLAAVDRLHEEGYVVCRAKGSYEVYASAKPYRQDADELSDAQSGAPGAQWCPRGAGHRAGGVVPLVPGPPLTEGPGAPPLPPLAPRPIPMDGAPDENDEGGYLLSLAEHYPGDLEDEGAAGSSAP